MHDRENARAVGTDTGRGPVRKPAPAPLSPQTSLLGLQGTVGNATVLQMLRRADQNVPAVQRSAVHDVLRTPGRPLDDATRTDMEARFGTDFSDVRVHTDAAAKASAAEVGARAYTSGHHVVIGDGGADRHTLAHELTHVVQQRRGPVAGTDNGAGLKVSDPSDRYEREAETNARRVLSTAPVQRSSDEAGARRRTGGRDVVQRMPTSPASAQTQDEQVQQLGFLVAFYVPVETFGENGEPPAMPTQAWLTRQSPDDVDLLRVESSFAPPRQSSGRRGNAVQTQWSAAYQSSFFVYTIELVNDPGGLVSRTLIDTDAPFTITRRIPRGSGGRSSGRTYAFGDRWGVDPSSGLSKETAAQLYGLDPDGYVEQGDAARQGLAQLPSDTTQAVTFYVPAGRNDPKFLNNDRRFMSTQGFDALGNATRWATALSARPQVDRRDGQRSTAAAMGNTQAHAWMGPGNGGSVGQLAKYEWCHLVGDGDGGPSAPENLVIGTNAVNTEQLAMETGLRDLVPQVRARGFDIRLQVIASLQEAPMESEHSPSDFGLPDLLQADWISYDISLVPLGQVNGRQRAVHRQIMDATRGTITESEFVVLQATVKRAIRAALDG